MGCWKQKSLPRLICSTQAFIEWSMKPQASAHRRANSSWERFLSFHKACTTENTVHGGDSMRNITSRLARSAKDLNLMASWLKSQPFRTRLHGSANAAR
eukprot:444422-Pyramimonas_sp.AAC.1